MYVLSIAFLFSMRRMRYFDSEARNSLPVPGAMIVGSDAIPSILFLFASLTIIWKPGTGQKVVYIISFFHVLLAREKLFLIRIHALAPQSDIVWLETVDYMSEKGAIVFVFVFFFGTFNCCFQQRAVESLQFFRRWLWHGYLLRRWKPLQEFISWKRDEFSKFSAQIMCCFNLVKQM